MLFIEKREGELARLAEFAVERLERLHGIELPREQIEDIRGKMHSEEDDQRGGGDQERDREEESAFTLGDEMGELAIEAHAGRRRPFPEMTKSE